MRFVFGTCLLVLAATSVRAGDGSLDNSFGVRGMIRTVHDITVFKPLGATDIFAVSVEIRLPDSHVTFMHVGTGPSPAVDIFATAQLDGVVVTAAAIDGEMRTYLAGMIENRGPVLYRFLSTGVVDSAFGAAGAARIAIGFYPNRIVWWPSGDVAIVGWRAADGYSLCPSVVRWKTDGKLDSEFAAGGVFMVATDGHFDAAAVLPDGRLLVGGTDLTNRNGLVVRLRNDGSLDQTFNPNGRQAGIQYIDVGGVPGFNDKETIMDITALSDGSVVYAGDTGQGGFNDALFGKLTVDGLPFEEFGSHGVAGQWAALGMVRQIAVEHDGRIILLGEGNFGFDQGTWLGRSKTNGSFDPTFGAGGVVRIGPHQAVATEGSAYLRTFAFQRGHIVLGGVEASAPRFQYGLFLAVNDDEATPETIPVLTQVTMCALLLTLAAIAVFYHR